MSLPKYFKGTVSQKGPEITIPTFFSGTSEIFAYDYDLIDEYVKYPLNRYTYIPNLSYPNDVGYLCKNYLKSILYGYNHVYITRLLESLKTRGNLCLPLIHSWEGTVKIDNVVIITHPDDAERICQKHIKKAPIFKSFLYDSIISTTDNDDWKTQRSDMNMAFIPSLSLKRVFPTSLERAKHCCEILKESSENFRKSVNMSEFFLNETQAQLQLSMFGFTNEFQERTNKRIRDAFAGIHTEYTDEFSEIALKATNTSSGPLSQLLANSGDPLKAKGNALIFTFAGHDTTGHTLSWLLYELCRHPEHKRRLIDEIDGYWRNNPEPRYETFSELPFLTRCLTETLRLWPALANGTYRELESDESIVGINGEMVVVPKGTYCQVMNWQRHRDPHLWGSDATVFNPLREFKDSEIWNHKGFGTTNVSSERFSPFTYGPRNCIGKNFSHMEMRLILLHIFRKYDFEFAKEQPREVLGLNTFTLGPKSYKKDEMLGLYLSVIPRHSRL